VRLALARGPGATPVLVEGRVARSNCFNFTLELKLSPIYGGVILF